MANIQDIKDRIDDLLSLRKNSRTLELNRGFLDRAYEAYVWSLCKLAVETAGGQAVLTGINSKTNLRSVILRGSPGRMHSCVQDYCYIDCRLNEKAFEIHVDVQYEGKSKARHEVDISLYDHDSAEKIRASGQYPKFNKLIAVIECKFYTSAPVDTSQGRQFVGLLRDFPQMRMGAFVCNWANQNLRQYLSIDQKVEPFTDLEPGEQPAERLFVHNLAQALRKWAQLN